MNGDTLPHLINHIDRIGLEDEGAVPAKLYRTEYFHQDCSVDTGHRDDDYNGDYECECDECMACDFCDDNVYDCTCNERLRCGECDNAFSRCMCHENMDKTDGCDTCKELDYICQSCIRDAFNNNSYSSSDETHISCSGECGCGDREHYDGEIVSPALKYEEIEQWMDNNHVENSNTSCGGHRHFSFKHNTYAYSILLNSEFNDNYLPKYLYEWAELSGVRKGSALYVRLEGDEHFCQGRYNAHRQLTLADKSSDRYMRVNYCYTHSKREHGVGTVEIRVLPEFQSLRLMKSATHALAHIVDSYIEENKNSLHGYRLMI